MPLLGSTINETMCFLLLCEKPFLLYDLGNGNGRFFFGLVARQVN